MSSSLFLKLRVNKLIYLWKLINLNNYTWTPALYMLVAVGDDVGGRPYLWISPMSFLFACAIDWGFSSSRSSIVSAASIELNLVDAEDNNESKCGPV